MNKNRPEFFLLTPEPHFFKRGLMRAGLGRTHSTTRFHDSVSRSKHGTLTGMTGAAWIFDPELGRFALDMPGTKDTTYVDCDTSETPSAYRFTLAAWVKLDNAPSNADNYQFLVNRGSIYDAGYGICYYDVNNATYQGWTVWCRGASLVTQASGVDVAANAWHHVAATYDGTNIAIYQDGVLLNSSAGADPATGSNPFRIGDDDRTDAAGLALDGKVGDVMEWNRPLPLAEIRILADRDPMLRGLIIPPYRTLHPAAAAAPSGAISGSGSIALAASGAIAGEGSLSGSVSLTLTLTGSLTTPTSITVSSPVQYQVFQRNGSDQADIAISGTYEGGADAVEASFNGGAYATIDANPSGGTFSGSLTGQAAGQGTLAVRFVNYTDISDTVADVGIGDVFLVIGDSIAQGAGTNAQNHGHLTLKATCYREDDAWKEANDPVDTGTSSGSHWPLLAKHIMDHESVPVALVTCATGSTDLAGTYNQWADGESSYLAMVAQVGDYGGSFKAILAHFGPNAVSSNLSQATYNAAIDSFIAAASDDVQASIKMYLGLFGKVTTVSGLMDTLRYGIMEAWGDNASAGFGPVLIDQDYSDGVHPKSDAELAIVAGRWWAAIHEQLYGDTAGSGRGPRIDGTGYSGTTITLVFDCDLATATTYTATAFTVTDGSGSRTIDSVTKTGTRTVAIVVTGAALADTVTVTFASDNTAAGATVPTRTYTLPSSATVALPAEPFTETVSLCEIGGTVTLSGSGVGSLKVYIIDTADDSVDVATTDGSGNYSYAALPGHIYLVIPAGYTSGETKYNALSKPYVEP